MFLLIKEIEKHNDDCKQERHVPFNEVHSARFSFKPSDYDMKSSNWEVLEKASSG